MPRKNFIIFLLLTFSLIKSDQEMVQSDLDSDCTNRWIHIRHLPTRFNLDLLKNCSAYQLFDDFCPYVTNHGLGQKTHNRSHSWFRTDPYMLELFFHRRILEYPCLTSDPASADAVFLPYYAGIDALRYLYGPEYNVSVRHGVDLFRYIKQNSPNVWGRYGGHDHFLVMARTAWDFSQPLPGKDFLDLDLDSDSNSRLWGTSFLELPEFYNATALTFEGRAYPWQEQAIPYPTSFHPPNLALLDSWVDRVRKSKRTTLMIFSGGATISASRNVRRSILLECGNASLAQGNGYSKLCDLVDCSNGICEHDPIRFMKPMLQSSFCLQPPGDTPTRRSTFDGILAGCIPVFFEALSAKSQYTWHLPEDEYKEFSVFIPKEEVVYKGLKILDVLLGIPKAQVRRMREKVVEIMPRIMYRKHGSSLGLRTKKDAFDIAIDGTLQRIKSRLKEVADQ